MVVTDTGMNTEMGKIADALSRAEQGQTPLQIKLSQLSKILTWLVLGICVVIFGVQIAYAGGITGEVILDSFMVAVSLAVAAIRRAWRPWSRSCSPSALLICPRRNAIIRR